MRDRFQHYCAGAWVYGGNVPLGSHIPVRIYVLFPGIGLVEKCLYSCEGGDTPKHTAYLNQSFEEAYGEKYDS